MGSLLALLLVCGAVLLGGLRGAGPQVTNGRGLLSAEAEIPLLNAAVYPKDFKRNPDSRWRQGVATDDLYDSDPPSSHLGHCAITILATGRNRPPMPKHVSGALSNPHRPQAARAPPLA